MSDGSPSATAPGAEWPQSSRRVLVLAADVGEGHLAAARALAAEFASDGSDAEVVVRDGLEGLGWFVQRVIRDGSRFHFQRLPKGFGMLYAFMMRAPRARMSACGALCCLGSRPLLRLINAHQPDIVVSTYPGVSLVLGHLRRCRRLAVPACSMILDLASLPFWAHPGIDLHLVMYEASLQPVERIAGPGSVRRVRLLVEPAFRRSRTRREAREALGLPVDGKVVVVSGGGWGIGDLEGAVRAAMGVEGTTVLCAAGRNDVARRRLEDTFAASGRARVFGFTEHMSDFLAAADVLVHSAGGVTCAEAIVRGCPAVVYGAPPGHWRANAKAMAGLGLAVDAQSPLELEAALRRILERPLPPPAESALVPHAAALVTTAESRSCPPQRRRPESVRAASVLAAVTVASVAAARYLSFPLAATSRR